MVQPRRFLDQLAEFFGGELVRLQLTKKLLIVPQRAIAGEEVGADLRGGHQFRQPEVAEHLQQQVLVEGESR